jgi:hypothetical protein
MQDMAGKALMSGVNFAKGSVQIRTNWHSLC